MKLGNRKYEADAVDNLRELFKTNRRVVAVGPTGCGKTVIASMFIKATAKRYPRVLFVAHRYELIDQAYRSLTAMGIEAGILMAQEEARGRLVARTNPTARVQVASVQTVARRGGPDDVDLIIFDEAHHATADSYRDIAEAYPDAHVLGLTATPCRSNGSGLRDEFDAMYIIAKPSQLYPLKYLARPEVLTAPIEVLAKLGERVRKATVADGDYTLKSLAEIVNSRFLVGKVVDEAKRLVPGVPKVVFAGSVKHSRELAAAFSRRGIKARHLDGETPPDERAAILADLRDGRIEVVCNFAVLGEGWDLPALGAVILARPTRSLSLFLQMTGRSMRWWKGTEPKILDHGNNTLLHQAWPGDDIDWTLEGTPQKRGADENGDPVVKACPGCLVAIPGGCRECPACGATQEMAADKRLREREEIEANLESARRARRDELRPRVEKLAAVKNAPVGWVERVLQEMVQ